MFELENDDSRTLFEKESKSGAMTKTKSGPRAITHGRGTIDADVFSEF